MNIPDSMKEELGSWNNGKGLDLETWVSCSGNFSLAVGYITLFCPKFIEFEDYIFKANNGLDENFIRIIRSFESQKGSHPMSVERVINHIHIADLHCGDEGLTLDKLIVLGEALKENYEARLTYFFPNKPCVVEFYKPENTDDFRDYQLSFWQKKHEKSR